MGPIDILNHALNMAAPALFVAAMLPTLLRLTGRAGAAKPAFALQWALNSGASLAALTGGLWWTGHDGSMAAYCAMLLAQHGAQVIKVESLGEGDWARALGVRYGSHTAFSIIGNLGKRSIAVDLKTDAGKQVVWRLLDGADVFLEGFRPGVIGRLGFDYAAVSARVPRILYLSISGFGQTGPLAERPAMDPVLQAYTGLMSENRGEDGIPHRVPVIVADMSTALYAYQALAAALYARRDETRGRYLDASLMQAATALQSIRLMACHLEGGTMKPGGAPGDALAEVDDLEPGERRVVTHPSLTSSLPKFSPRSRPMKARGALSMPSTMSSRYFSLPLLIHSPIWRIAGP